jgi:hypothetical protein
MIALGVCAAILVAAGIGRALHPHDASSSSTATATSTAAATATATAAPTPAATATATAPPAPAPPPTPATGTLTLDKPATAGKVWLDGKKVTVKSGEVPCGKHQLKIGRGKPRSVTIPCGDELHVSK